MNSLIAKCSDRDIFFLACGYYLDNKPAIELDLKPSDTFNFNNFDEAKIAFKSQWKEVFKNQFETKLYKDDLVPLSGGIDSRALLMEMLKYKSASDIYTLTFGVEGSLDFEIGNSIAKFFGTKHTAAILDSNTSFSLKNVLHFGFNTEFSTNLFLTPPLHFFDDHYSKNIWSGTIVDVFFGKHKHKLVNPLGENLAKQYISENILVDDLRDHVSLKYVLENLSLPYSNGRAAHIADLANRQVKFVAKHLLLKDFTYLTMLDDSLISLALAIDDTFLKEQRLYIDSFTEMYSLFNKFGCKSTWGARLDASASIKSFHRLKNKFSSGKYVNYIDWEKIMGLELLNDILDYIDNREVSMAVALAIEQKKNPFYVMNLLSLKVNEKNRI